MKKMAKVVALAVLAAVSLAWLGVLSIHGPQAVRTSLEVVKLKLSGQAPYLTWHQAFSYILPSGLRPSEMIPLEHLERCGRIAVRLVQEGNAPCSALWETPLGRFWAGRQDGDVLASVIDEVLGEGIYNRPPVAVRPGDVVVDGGAHVGVFVRFAIGKGAGKVVAFEPDARNAECLKRNFESEVRDGRVALSEKALWDRPGRLRLMREDNSARSRVQEQAGGPTEAVAATTIDEAVREWKLERVDFIKLDVEGSERQAMSGAAQTLRRFGPRLVLCTYHWPDDAVKVTETVLRLRPSYWVFATAKQAYFYEGGGLSRPGGANE